MRCVVGNCVLMKLARRLIDPSGNGSFIWSSGCAEYGEAEFGFARGRFQELPQEQGELIDGLRVI